MNKYEADLKIAIIGGGPAGSFTCHFLNKFAKKNNKTISIHMYDYKCFTCQGKSSCNMCAGIIASTLVEHLEKEKIFLPDSVIKSEISGYQLHSKYNTVYFQRGDQKKIYSVFRGQGPLNFDGKISSFDQFLSDFMAKEKNVSIIHKKVTDIDFSHKDFVEVKAEDNVITKYDFVVGAFGVNTKIKNILKTGYKPPKTVQFLQLETELPEDFIQRTYRGRVHMFPVYKNNIWFITLTPKWNFITVTVVGKNVKLKDVKSEILNNKNIKNYLPGKELNVRCSCAPGIPVSLSKKPYSNRFLVVGDACVSRYLKNGIESAFQTAFFAADTIINHGLTGKIIKKWYYNRCKKQYRIDNLCGKILYLMHRVLYIHPLYTESQMVLAKKEQITRVRARFSEILWDMFTGDKKYKAILKNALHPYLVYSIAKQFVITLGTSFFKGKSALHFPTSKFYKLLNKSTVAIIGGGPAGSACAIKLAKLSKEKNLNINIFLFEGKDFHRHHNQCVGILSPPLLEIFEKELDVKLPGHLIKSEVPGYELHTEKESIFLKSYHQESPKTFSVRRSELDGFLLNKAKEQGVKVIRSRVTDIEFCRDIYHDEVRIFAESTYLKADAVVCAFGLDSEMLERLKGATRKYRRPKRIMKTFVTRIDFPEKLLDKSYDKRIFVFLLSSIKHAVFGAVTVKDDHIVVNIAGEKITSLNLKEFIAINDVTHILPDGIMDNINCFCGRFPSSPAKHPYGDRYVAIGDTTGWLRPLKGKGINLAVITGINAAKVMVNEGFSKKDFENYKKLCKEFIQDYKYGVFVRLGLRIAEKTGILNFIIRLAKKGVAPPTYSRSGFISKVYRKNKVSQSISKKNSRIYNMLYDAVSAEKSYKNTLLSLFKRQKK
jgi:flavin-dependent dehydrogenase